MDTSPDTGLMNWLNRPCPLVIDELDPLQVNAFAGTQFKGRMHVVRLDKTHPIISGNKWFKLKYRLKSLIEQGVQQLVSFGGPYSNHLHALGYAAKTFGFSMTAIIRGEAVTNPMITDLHSWGVECRFVDRQTYRALCRASGDFSYEGVNGFAIPEGGADALSLKGCAEIMTAIDDQIPDWDYLLCAMGTGATLAGLISAQTRGSIIGMPALKQGGFLAEDVQQWLESTPLAKPDWSLDLDGHYGGFGKIKPDLQTFMTRFETDFDIPLEPVYTAKLFRRFFEKLSEGEFSDSSSILLIHTGGLQGRRLST